MHSYRRRRLTGIIGAAAAAATVTAGFGTGLGAGAVRAEAAMAAPAGVAARAVPGTISCGGACFSLYTRQLGPGVTMNGYIP
ncbi:MAG: hypothetical protein ACYCPF_10250, partial [Streptosporangiaceae bacterium]